MTDHDRTLERATLGFERPRTIPSPVTVVWVLLALAAIADIGTTLYGFHLGFTEWNPVAKPLLLEYGLVATVALKGGAIGYTALAFVVIRRLGSRTGAVVTVALVACTWLVAAGWNLLVVLGLIP